MGIGPTACGQAFNTAHLISKRIRNAKLRRKNDRGTRLGTGRRR